MLRPAYLQPGDKVLLIAPSGITKRENIDKIINLIISWDLVPVLANHIFSVHEPFAGNDVERLADWQDALDSEEVRAIWCTDGSYGTNRIVEQADYSIFQGNPKWIIGMDDITLIHSKLHSLGVESLYSFMASGLEFTNNESTTQLRNFLYGIVPDYSIEPHHLNRPGYIEADFTGGTLSWLSGLPSTWLDHKLRKTILFIEDAETDFYKIDRSIRCLKHSGQLQNLKGLIVGQMGQNATYEFKEEAYRLIHDAIEEYNYPVCFNFPTGHSRENYPLILGTTVKLGIHPKGCELHFT